MTTPAQRRGGEGAPSDRGVCAAARRRDAGLRAVQWNHRDAHRDGDDRLRFDARLDIDGTGNHTVPTSGSDAEEAAYVTRTWDPTALWADDYDGAVTTDEWRVIEANAEPAPEPVRRGEADQGNAGGQR